MLSSVGFQEWYNCFMWMEILLIFAAIASILSFFGLPAKRIAKLAKQHITRNKFSFSLAAIVTTGAIYVQVLSVLYLRPIGWGLAALVLWLCFVAWQPVIDAHFSSRIILRKVISLIVRFGAILALVVIFITWDAPVWRKAVLIGGSFALGFAAHVVEDYIRRRRAIRKESSHKT